MANLECDLIHLRCENQRLREEIVQLSGDKEFVWSLWKRLQVANPDLTQAVGLIMAREKTKNEDKDAKILGLLQTKDARIEELQKVLAHKDEELSDATQQKHDLLENVKQLESDLMTISDRNAHLEDRCLRRDDSSHNLEEKYRRVVEQYESEKLELGERVSLLQTQLTQRREEMLDLRAQLIESQATVTAAQREANAADQQLDALRQELTQYKTCAVDQKETAKTLEQALEEVRAQADEWRRRAQQLESMVQTNSRDVDCTRGGKLLASSVPIDESPVVDYEYRAVALQRIVDQLKLKLRSAQAGTRQTSSQQCRKRMRSSSAPAFAPVSSQLYERVNHLKKKLLSMEKLVNIKEEDRLHLVGELNQKNALLRKAKDANLHIKKRLVELESELHQVQTKSVDCLKNSDECRVSDELRGALSKLELRCRQLEDEAHRKTARAAEEASIAYELRQQLTAQQSEVGDLRSDLNKALQELTTHEEMTRAWNKERSGLRAELSCAAQEAAQKRCIVADLTREVAALRRALDTQTEQRRRDTVVEEEDEEEEEEEESDELEPVRDSDRTDLSLGCSIVKKAKATASRSGWEAAAAVGPLGSRLPLSTRLRRRVAALQQQLRATKRSHTNSQEELRKTHLRCQLLDKNLSTAHERNRRLHEVCSQLASDLEQLQQQPSPPPPPTTSECTAIVADSEAAHTLSTSTCGDVEIRALESRARAAAHEVTRQAGVVRQLRVELDTKDQAVTDQKTRITHLERDLTQKRTVIESMKQRLAQSAESALANKKSLEAGEERLRESQAVAERHRVQVDSLRVRLGALTKEKQRWLSEATEAEKTVEEQRRAVHEAQEARRQALRQCALAEERATRQCEEASQRTQTALLEARDQLQKAHVRLMQCERFVSLLTRVICAKMEQGRLLVAQLLDAARRRSQSQRRRHSREMEGDVDSCTASLQAARDRAAHLLNLSTWDVDDMLNQSNEAAAVAGSMSSCSATTAVADNEDKMRDRNFIKKCSKLFLSNNCHFAEKLADYVAEKLDELFHLIKRLEEA